MNYFLPFHPFNSPKNENITKLKKIPGDIIILHKCTKNHDHRLHCSWDMARFRCNCYFSFCAIFCPFTSLTAQKMKISKKWKKPLEISSFYTSVPKNHDYMLYCSWDMAHDRCNCYFSFWAIFCPFAPITAQKIKIKKNKIKKCLEISSFYTSIPKIMIICYTVPEIQPMTHVIIFHFGLFFALLPP